MTRDLPDGLVRSNNLAASSSRAAEPAAAEDIYQVWKAYSVGKRAMQDGVGERFENLFWRILSSHRLQENLTGGDIALLHAIVSRNLPLHKTSLSWDELIIERPSTLQQYPDLGTGQHRPTDDLNTSRVTRLETIAVGQQQYRERSTSRPRPILRTPGIDAESQGKSARILTPTWVPNAKGKGAARVDLHHPRVISDRRLPPQLPLSDQESIKEGIQTKDFGLDQLAESSTSSSTTTTTNTTGTKAKRSPSFVVGKRRRPGFARRTSSQSIASTTTKSPSSVRLLSATPEHPENDRRSQSYEEQVAQRSRANSDSMPTIKVSASFPTQLGSPYIPRVNSERTLQLLSRNSTSGQLPSSSIKSSLTTGVSLATPITASLQSFSGRSLDAVPEFSAIEHQDGLHSQDSTLSSGHMSRSRTNLNQLLQKDRSRPENGTRGKRR